MTSTWPPDPDRWHILRTYSNDQPPEHDPARPWAVVHPNGLGQRRRQITHHATHADALAFVLAQPEVRRRTSRKAPPRAHAH